MTGGRKKNNLLKRMTVLTLTAFHEVYLKQNWLRQHLISEPKSFCNDVFFPSTDLMLRPSFLRNKVCEITRIVVAVIEIQTEVIYLSGQG